MEIGIRADLVQCAAQKELVRRDALQIKRARRHQKDLVRRGGKVVLAVAAVFEVGVHGFARSLEVDDRVADFLHLPPERRVEPGRSEENRAHARVDAGLPQVFDDRADRRRPDAAQISEHVRRHHLGNVAADAQLQHRVRGDARFARNQQIEKDESGNRDDERDAEEREDDGNATTRHSIFLASGARAPRFISV
jgi:hypothetical protein